MLIASFIEKKLTNTKYMDIITEFTIIPKIIYNYIYDFIVNPSIIIIIVIIILFSYFFIILGNSNTSPQTAGTINYDYYEHKNYYGNITNFIYFIVFLLFFIITINLIYPGIFNVFNYTTTTNLSNLFSDKPTINVNVETNSPSIDNNYTQPQVFNIPGNYYSYNDAKSLCKAYDSRLANYNEIEKAYNNGAEWCNYGWSEDQMALYPTQAETYKNLQKITGHEHDCGRPGINGGYIANPNIRFGVNCYGHKPKMTPEEEDRMATTTPYPLTEEDLLMERKVKFWKQKLPEILVSPFNYNNWSKI